MSKSFLTVHDFSSINVGSIEQQVYGLGSSYTVGNSNSGDFMLLNATGGSAVILPSVSAGLDFKFIVSNTGAHTVTAPSGTLFGAVNVAISNSAVSSNLVASANGVISTTAGSAVGDRFSVLSDGTNYYVSGTVARSNGLNFT